MKIQTVFERTETKYILTLSQRRALLEKIEQYVKPDEYGESTVCSLYFDTDNHRLIRQSMEKPTYKEKLRLRSYGTPKRDGNVFLELKKKYNGVVYKRRLTLSYNAAMAYIRRSVLPEDSQIMREIDWAMKYYEGIAPKMFIAYDRTAFYSKQDHELRVTFDRKVFVGEKKVPGIAGLKSVHQTPVADRSKIPSWGNMYIDIGAKDRAEAEEKVSVGDVCVFDSDFVRFGTGNDFVKAKERSVP